MKNIITITLLIIAISVNAQSLEKRNHQNFTPDQIAEIQTKRMTLHLELTESQQQQIFEINKINATERKQKVNERKALREKGEKPSSQGLFERKNSQLDAQIAHQNKMKNILNEEQFDIWKKARAHQKMQLKKRVKRHKIKKHIKAHKRQE